MAGPQNLRVVSTENKVYVVFEEADGIYYLEIDRTTNQVPNEQIFNAKTKIVQSSVYQNKGLERLVLASSGPVVSLIFVPKPDPASPQRKIHAGRIQNNQWTECPNSPRVIAGSIVDLYSLFLTNGEPFKLFTSLSGQNSEIHVEGH